MTNSCIVQDVTFASPNTHEYAFCDICDGYTPLVFCEVSEEHVCGICHMAYPEEYHS